MACKIEFGKLTESRHGVRGKNLNACSESCRCENVELHEASDPGSRQLTPGTGIIHAVPNAGATEIDWEKANFCLLTTSAANIVQTN